MSNPDIHPARYKPLESDAVQARHEQAFALLRERSLRGCGPIRVLLWIVAFPVAALLAILNVPLALLFSWLLPRAPGCLFARRQKTEEVGEWMRDEAPRPGCFCYPNPCLCWPVCCWRRAASRAEIPEVLQGTYWMEGNVADEDFMTFEDGTWNPATRTMTKRLYDPGGWTNPVRFTGALSYWVTRLIRMEVDFVFEERLRDAYMVFYAFGLEFPYFAAGMTFHRGPDDGSLWFRKNSVGTMEYCVVRIVNSDNSKTKAFGDMMARTGVVSSESGYRGVALEQFTGRYCGCQGGSGGDLSRVATGPQP